MWNVHMLIRIGIRKIRNTDDSLGSDTKLLLPSLSLGFRNEERETIFLCWLFVHRQLSTHWPNQRACALQSTNWTGLAQVRKINTLCLSSNLNSLLFFSKSLRVPVHRFRAWRHSHPQSHFAIWGFYYDISDRHILPARAWTPALMSAPSRKVVSLTKPKDMIYKTKNDNIKNIPSAII